MERIPKTRQSEDFLIDNIATKVAKSKLTKFLFAGLGVTSVSALTACDRNPPVAEAAPLPSADETVTPPIEVAPTATLAPTETEDPFKGLNECRTWREAANCPITEKDFGRISDYVKANYKFSPEALKVSSVSAVPMPAHTSFISIHGLINNELLPGFAEKKGVEGKKYVFDDPWSPVGKPFFFNLKSNPPRNNYDNLVAVFPVNNADGSPGTYTVILPPRLFGGNYKTAEEYTNALSNAKFGNMPYLPPVYNIGEISEDNLYRYSPDDQGSLITEIIEDTKNQENGGRKKLFDEWLETVTIPSELEKMPLLGSDFDLNCGSLLN